MAGLNGIPQQLSNMIDRFNYLRTGSVVQVDPFFVTIEFPVTTEDEDEITMIRAAYVRQAEPAVGDTVAVMRQGASWLVSGTTSTTSGNSVQNPSFELTNPDSSPVDWFRYAVSGTSGMQVIEDTGLAVEGDHVLDVAPVGTGSATVLAYSQPIAVDTGQQWELSAYVNGYYPGDNPDTADVQLRALWFGSAIDLYPTTAAPDTTAATANNIPEDTLMSVIRGTVTVPAGPSFMRIGLRSALSPFTGTRWDFATARRVG